MIANDRAIEKNVLYAIVCDRITENAEISSRARFSNLRYQMS